ncbi:hypothetical protein FA95DRAFT_1566915 [Auriscalpium vulgare]|uniref:Uncharacterized protein n=1 Tax=Auriscalpium vulgare TaxID=40419 RepID=A0ACB8R6X9_9AGAM|nr:hypothetical protein FA95DRAFT_1566915 [Auriscalpium vulgare]
MLGLRDKATTLMNDGPIAGSTDMLARVPDSGASSLVFHWNLFERFHVAWKKFSKSFGKIGVMLRDGEGIWRLILDADKCVFAALLRADEDHFIEGRSIKQLKKMLCRIHKDKCTLQRLSMTSW